MHFNAQYNVVLCMREVTDLPYLVSG